MLIAHVSFTAMVFSLPPDSDRQALGAAEDAAG